MYYCTTIITLYYYNYTCCTCNISKTVYCQAAATSATKAARYVGEKVCASARAPVVGSADCVETLVVCAGASSVYLDYN